MTGFQFQHTTQYIQTRQVKLHSVETEVFSLNRLNRMKNHSFHTPQEEHDLTPIPSPPCFSTTTAGESRVVSSVQYEKERQMTSHTFCSAPMNLRIYTKSRTLLFRNPIKTIDTHDATTFWLTRRGQNLSNSTFCGYGSCLCAHPLRGPPGTCLAPSTAI